MDIKGWAKTAAMAIGGGALGAVSASLMDPTRFNFKSGIGIEDELGIAAQGALTGLVGLFLASPKGREIVSAAQKAQGKPKQFGDGYDDGL
jgi:hypothetical protein